MHIHTCLLRATLTKRTEIEQLANSPRQPLLSSWLDCSCSYARYCLIQTYISQLPIRRVDKAGVNGFSRTPPEKIIDHSTMQGHPFNPGLPSDSSRYVIHALVET